MVNSTGANNCWHRLYLPSWYPKRLAMGTGRDPFLNSRNVLAYSCGLMLEQKLEQLTHPVDDRSVVGSIDSEICCTLCKSQKKNSIQISWR